MIPDSIRSIRDGSTFEKNFQMEQRTRPTFLKTSAVFILLTGVMPFSALAQLAYLSPSYQQPRPFLYEVEKDGKVSHILGSLHAGIPLSTFPASIYQFAAEASAMAFECDPDELIKEYAQDIQAASLYPNGQSLEQNISQKAVQKLKDLYGEKGFSLLNKYKPWFAAVTLAQDASGSLKNQSPDVNLWEVEGGIDVKLLNLSKQKKKSITYIDNLSDTVSSFEKNFSAADLEMLLSDPDPIAHISSCAIMAQRAYLDGSEEGFQAYDKSCETESSSKSTQQRTISWIPKIEALLKNGGAFVVVGVDHMHGPNGIEALLKSKGYKIKRISSSGNVSQNSSIGTATISSPGVR
jgi:hypothetical protein